MSKATAQRLSAQEPCKVDTREPRDKRVDPQRRYLAFYMHHLHGGGVSKMCLILARALADRYENMALTLV